jgi:hypothetical protein
MDYSEPVKSSRVFHALVSKTHFNNFVARIPGSTQLYHVQVSRQESHQPPFFSRGVRLGPFGTAATVWPTVPAPDDR